MKTTLSRKLAGGSLALVVLTAVLGTGSSRFVDAHGAPNRSGALHLKVNRAIADSLNAGPTTFRVLVKLRPGTVGRVAERLATRGHPPRLAFPPTHTLVLH